MTNEKLRQLALDIGSLIEQYGVDYTKLAVNIVITEKYHETIKDTVESDAPTGLDYFHEHDADWSIMLVKPMKLGKLSDNNSE